MSSGTNPERLSQNNILLTTNNTELTNLKTLINELPTQLNTSDADATENDIALGKSAYVKGEKVTGIINTVNDNERITTQGTFREDTAENRICLDYTFLNSKLFRSASQHTLYIPESTLASSIGLTADILATGNTVLGITGTNKGLDTSDGTATETDIRLNRTAYVNGEKITGTLETVSSVTCFPAAFTHKIVSELAPDTTTPCIKFSVIRGRNDEADCIVSGNSTITGYIAEEDIADAIGLVPGIIVEGNTILGVAGTATELEVTKTEIWNTTNNNIIVGLDDLNLYTDQGTIGFRVNIPSSITEKDQILISGTGYIELQSNVYDTGCLCTRLTGLEALDTYMKTEKEIVIIIDEEGTYLGTYQCINNIWTEIVSPTAYDKTLTIPEYDEAVATSEEILGGEGI